MNKEEISKMTKAEQIRQLEWSDHHEFSYGYAYYLLKENEQLKERINKAIEYILDTCVDNMMYDGVHDYMFDKTNPNELLAILKGGSNE